MRRSHRRRSTSLAARLVATAVALVAAVCVLVTVTTAVAVSAYLTDRLDDDLQDSLARTRGFEIREGFDGRGGPPDPGDGPQPSSGSDPGSDPGPVGQAVGTLVASWSPNQGSDDTVRGEVIVQTADGEAERRALPAQALAVLTELPADGSVHEVELAGYGTYRVALAETGTGRTVASGLPTDEVGDAVATLIAWEALLVVVGSLVAVGAGLVLVRRQLRPLQQVAQTARAVSELPLAKGDIDLAERVPEHLTDERSEVGQVGGALNALLAHVETALSERHRSEQQVRQFVADASHELRTPLATIAGYTELARRHDDGAAVRVALAKVEEESARMASLVEDLLLLARLDSGRPLAREPVDLVHLVLEAVSDARVLEPDHHWRLELPDEPVELVGDEQRLHQVVTNLLTNARKYTSEGTTVTVTVDEHGFAVHDDGPGFPPEVAGQAFERFVRGDVSRNRAGGAGLGLSLVRAIVHSHGGTVHLATRPGDTTVRVDLPAVPDGVDDADGARH